VYGIMERLSDWRRNWFRKPARLYRPCEFDPRPLRPGRYAVGAATGFEHQWQPLRPWARHPHLPLATAQPVEGAALIRR
jgi:hypothetical protein